MRAVASATILGVIVAGLGSTFLQADTPTASQPTSHTHTRVLESYGRLPLHFERNDGQVDASVRFLARGSGYSLFLKPTEAVLTLRQRATANVAVLQFTLAGGNRRPTVAGRGELPGRINYFVGDDPAGWRTNIATYARVHYSDVYPGIDLVYYGNQQQLEYDFVVAPGADPRRIRMVFDRARAVSIDGDGDLILSVEGGEVRQLKPIVYQEANGVREPIAGRYVRKGRREIRFELGAYDRTRPLVIDPVLVYSTYLGGSSTDAGNDIAVDAQGNAYVGGETSSADFPTASAADASQNGRVDGFVTKLNATGSVLIYSTYLGSAADDRVNGIAVDALGSAYVTGETNANPLNAPFPTTTGAFDTTANGAPDAFVAKLDGTGATLLYSTYLGGTSADWANAIALDAAGNAYVTGQTFSSAFPTTALPFDGTHNGATDVFVTKVNPDGSGLLYSTYLGGGSIESGNGIAVDASGHAYVTGDTESVDFPTALAFDNSRGAGGSDAFVTKLNVAGSALDYSTYLGGFSQEMGNGIAVDDAGRAYVTGETSSDDFPTTLGAHDRTRGGISDAFVTRMSPTGSALEYATYLGGGSGETGTDIAVDASSNANVTGFTSSTNFPTSSDALQPTLSPGGLSDVFVTRLNATGAALIYSTYLGGTGADSGNGIALDSRAYVYVTGVTRSANFPTTEGAFDIDGLSIGAAEAFVAKIGGGVPASLTLNPPSDINVVGTTHCVVATVTDPSGNRVPNTTVRFAVMGPGRPSGSKTTDAGGQAEFCYEGPTIAGRDAILAFADTDGDGEEDAGEPFAWASKTWVAAAPATLTLEPAADTNPVGTQHCVMATVRDAFRNPTPDILVNFTVKGAVNTTDSAATNSNGEARFCYNGPTIPGVDAISAFADTNADGAQGAGEPSGQAAKTWVAGSPSTLTLTPPTDTNPVDTQHCVMATVRDSFGNPTPGITVRFGVTGTVTTSRSGTTDAGGRTEFCYDGPTATGADAISAFADIDADGMRDVGEPGGEAAKTWAAGSPAVLTLTPPAATNPMGTQHCVMVEVSDAFDNPTPDVTVRFTVTGAVNTSGFATTDAAGRAGYCYTGPLLPGSDVITAYADTDADDVRDPGEPAGTATNTWTPSTSAGTCAVSVGGYIITSSGSRATFGGVAKSADGVAHGHEAYVDHGIDKATKMTVISQSVDSVDCLGRTATIFGHAWVHGYGTVMYRIDVTDGTYDTYSIQLSNGYVSGMQVVQGGNIKVF